MAKWTNYFKIVTPSPESVRMTNSQEMADGGAYNNYTWYQRLVQGSASRMTRYREYDLMDNDVEVARALDTIAEEMTGNNPKTNDPLELDILTEDENHVKSSSVLTIKAALRKWGMLHDWENKLFTVSRMLIKYGDVYFRKPKNIHDKWTFIHPKNVVAAIVSETDATKVVGWQIKNDIKKPHSGGTSLNLGPVSNASSQEQTEVVDALDIVRFTLNDDMSDTAPFGESVLRSVYRSHKQKELLEDAIIIYRVQRAPERRVFYIDVGKMPPQRVKAHLEGIKNEIKQKKVPTSNGGAAEVDSVYNPQSMCLSLDTEIPLLDGRTVELSTLISEHEEGKENWVYSIDPKSGDVVPGPISWAGITQTNAETIKLILDNGEEIVCTPEHKFPIQGHGVVEAKDITPEMSLWPYAVTEDHLTTPTGKTTSKYRKIYNPSTKSWKLVHRLVANYMKSLGFDNEMVHDDRYKHEQKRTIHHKNFNGLNNSPDNLAFMHHIDHVNYHKSLKNQEAVFPEKMISRFIAIANGNIFVKFKDLMETLNTDEVFMDAYYQSNKVQTERNYKLKLGQFRQKMFLKFIKEVGFKNWKEYQQSVIQARINIDTTVSKSTIHTNDDIKLIQHVLGLIKTKGIHNFKLVNHLKDHKREWNVLRSLYSKSNIGINSESLNTPEASMFERISKYFGYGNFKHMVSEAYSFNHRVVRIEKGANQNVGTLTIDQAEKCHNFHNFALKSGVYTNNSEDFFFASRPDGRGSRVETLPGGCLAMDTKIPLLDGRTLSLTDITSEYNEGKELWAYSTNPQTGEIVPGKIDWAGITHASADVMEIVLDNGEKITCTPDHKFPIWGKGFMRADEITSDDSFMHFETREESVSTKPDGKKYTQVYDHSTKKWEFVHRTVRKFMDDNNEVNELLFEDDECKHEIIHHANVNRFDNTPSNLAWMGRVDHFKLHGTLGKHASSKRLEKQNNDPVWKAAVYKKSGDSLRKRLAEDSELLNARKAVFAEKIQFAPDNAKLTFSPDMLTIVRYLFDEGTIQQAPLVALLNDTPEFMDLWNILNIQQQPLTNYEEKIVGINRITEHFQRHHLDLLLKEYGYDTWSTFKLDRLTQVDSSKLDGYCSDNSLSKLKTTLMKKIIKLTTTHYKPFHLISYLNENVSKWDDLVKLYNEICTPKHRLRNGKIRYHHFDRLVEVLGFSDYNDFLSKKALFNHKIVSVTKLEGNIPVGTLTIDQKEQFHSFHTFALDVGIFTKNSGLGELSDLSYFQQKVWRGLRVPASYMLEQADGGAMFSDGKVGTAYIQELRFALFVGRLQGYIEKTLDEEFKKYIRAAGINIDPHMYRIRTPEPSNFGKYRQYELDSALLSSFGSADGIQYLSKRFILEKYLMLSDEEIIRNERLKREEVAIDTDGGKEDYPTIYGDGQGGDGMGGIGGGGGGLGAMGGGLGGVDMDMEAGGEDAGGMEDAPADPNAEAAAGATS